MILTVTVNSALDRVLFVEEFRSGTTMRPQKMVESVGGKGLDASVVLQTLGVENLALGFVAGLTGQQLVKLLDAYGIPHDLIWVEGQTRIAHVVVETLHRRHSHIVAGGLSVSPKAYQYFWDRFQTCLDRATWVVTGGSLAAGVPVSCYRRLAEMARRAGVSILLDSFGPPLLEALPAQPTVVKMNRDEFGRTFGHRADSLSQLKAQAEAVREDRGLSALVLTCGAEGILAVTAECTYLAASPVQKAVNAAGAGDAVSAALAWRLSVGDRWPDALRWAAATGAAVVLTEGTADCHPADVERIVGQTRVRQM